MIEIELTKNQVPSMPGQFLQKYRNATEYYFGVNRNKRLLQTSQYTLGLGNHYDFQYYGTLYMGSSRQAMTFIFDTGSSWLWVPSDACPKTSCTGTTFHYGQSSTYQASSLSESITYGKGKVTGYVVSDQISLSSSSSFAAQSAKFLSIYQASDIAGLESDGLLGLSPNFMSTNSGELLITSLKKSGVISSQVFALSLQKTTTTSRMHFGGYESSFVINKYNSTFRANRTTDSLICWMSLTSRGYWQVQMDQVYVGSTMITTLMKKAVLDSGASLTYVPTKDYYTLYNAIFSGKNTANCNINGQTGILYCECSSILDSRYPTISLKFGGRYTFFMNPSDYLIYDSQTRLCIYTFQEDTDSRATFWLMGDPFLRAYYAIFDQDNQRVGLAGTYLDSGATVTSLSSSSDSSSDSSDDDTSGLIIYIASSIGSSLVMFLLICLLCRLCRKIRENELRKRNRIHMMNAQQHNLTTMGIIILFCKQAKFKFLFQLSQCQLVFQSFSWTQLSPSDRTACISNTFRATTSKYDVSIKSLQNTPSPQYAYNPNVYQQPNIQYKGPMKQH